MWWSPGILVAGVLVVLVYEATGTAAHWWLWIVAVLLAAVIDGLLGWRKRQVPKVKTETEYYKD